MTERDGAATEQARSALKPLRACVPPGGAIGVLGGGQLGRMLSIAAARLGLKTHVFAPEENSPAFDVCAARTIAAYDEPAALERFAAAVDAVTYEFENIPAETVERLVDLGAWVAPGAKALAVAQDRLREKEFVNAIGARTAPYHAVDDLASLEVGLKKIGRPAILKTRRFGYDGKGQTVIPADNGDLRLAWEEAKRKAWEEIGARPSILEGFIDFACEISVIGARGAEGDIALYDPPENRHQGGILRTSIAPASISEETADEARRITAKMLSELDYVGVIGVEFFVLKDGAVLVNEFAPRVHNSGHWTLDACAVSQFEQHIRAVAGWPLGDPARHSDAVMENLIGAEVDSWRECARTRQLCLHIYGKDDPHPGRKMGHVTQLKPRGSPRSPQA
ncbi:5-(carboxyamino)imidazole ribonucleotide synthase [Amphiplicatus metriothermophilus]|uniref:N5-carboxyaminoimidazole ribonucleotide synthase n=1 Tax=Amphiplicatus metriothermophilus TaxID=1519374 RepID=A0A239PZI7_9PROT|nr:5-(carboxyamino)imidazole ribonucleotide synthase [Amphiplicatus metriothermophilus]MBB5520152.1 5-(carboxyamino)imidazole ribonucleotide synthase [Amphiplicatus metriothermophilus]SNT75741.1 5-(carboxyamino)imidazole ribonucleotide synthase [Amphiplicatus metriothermophilus]